MKGPVGCPETSAAYYQYMLCNIQEEQRSNLDRGERLDGRYGPENVTKPNSTDPERVTLNPTGHMMHHQFNIQKLYALPTLYLCVLYLSENKRRLVPLTP
jgi:hypothetical protein